MVDRRSLSFKHLSGSERLVVFLLVVLVALVVAQQVEAAKERSLRAEMRFALTSFALAQESYFHDHRVYGTDLATFRDRGFSPVPGATIVVNEATAVGWSATARHSETRAGCFLYVRDAAPLGPATRQGVVSCG